MDFCRMSVYGEYDMVDDMQVYYFFTKFFICKLESIRHKHNRLESDFLRKCKHRKKISTDGNLPANDLEISSTILLCSEDIGKYFS